MSAPARLRRYLRRLDQSSLAALVADLHAAQGRETRVDGDAVVVERAGGTEVLWPVPARRVPRIRRAVPDRPIDAVVTAGDGGGHAARLAAATGARLVDGADLAERLWYGVDAAERDRLCERYLGVRPAEMRPSLAARVAAVGRAVADRVPDGSGHGRDVLRGVAAIVALVALAGVFVVATGGSVPGTGTATTTATTPTPDSTSTEANASRDTVVYLPGLDADGVTDADALASTHRRILAGRSYQTTHIHIGPTAGTDSFAVRWTGTAVGAGGEPVVRERIECWNGRTFTEVYVDDGTRYAAVYDDGRVEYAVRAASTPDPRRTTGRALREFLDAPETSVRPTTTDEESAYVVTARGRPPNGSYPPVGNYTAEAVVSDRGLVRRLIVRYEVRADNETRPVELQFYHAEVDETAVDPPSWYDPGLRNHSEQVPGDVWYERSAASRRRCQDLLLLLSRR